MKQLPIACTLSPAALDARRTDLSRLVEKISERAVSETSFVARFEPDAGILVELAEFAGVERECCRFLRFQITAEEDNGPIWLDISGPPGTGEFVEAMIG